MLRLRLTQSSALEFASVVQKRWGRANRVPTNFNSSSPSNSRYNESPGFGRDIRGVRYDSKHDVFVSDVNRDPTSARLPSQADFSIASNRGKMPLQAIGDKAEILGGILTHSRRTRPSGGSDTIDSILIPTLDQFDEARDVRNFRSKVALLHSSPFKIACGLLVHDASSSDLTIPHSSFTTPHGSVYALGGRGLIENLRAAGGESVNPGSVTVTEAAGRLTCDHVAHVRLPVYRKEAEATSFAYLAAAYHHILDAAAELGVESVVLPPLGTGTHGFPKSKAAEVAARSVAEWLAEHYDGKATGIDRIIFTTLVTDDWKMYDQWTRDRLNFTPETWKSKFLAHESELAERDQKLLQARTEMLKEEMKEAEKKRDSSKEKLLEETKRKQAMLAQVNSLFGLESDSQLQKAPGKQ